MVSFYSASHLRAVLSVLFCALTASAVWAQTVWTGSLDQNYFTASNWSNGLPDVGNNAIIPGGSTVLINGNLNANFRVDNFGAITLGGNLTVNDLFNSSGSLTTEGFRINVADSLTNFGVLEVSENGSLFTQNGGTFRTNGTINVAGWMGSVGNMSNEGTINIQSGAGLAVYNGGVFNNPGFLNISGFFNNRNNGTYNAPSGGTITVMDGGRLSNYSLSTINNAGIIRIDAGGKFDQKSTLNNNPGRLFISGQLTTFDSSITMSNFLTVEAGGNLNVDKGTTFEIVFSLVNNGTTRLNRPAIVGGLITNGADASFTITGLGELDFILGTNLNNFGTFLNLGSIRTVGTLNNDGNFTNSGQIIQNNGGTIANNKTFLNTALIESANQIINNDKFTNEGRLTNASGGQIENNALFTNAVDAHIENLFEIFNRDTLVNRGHFENGVSLFNEKVFNNYGSLDNVGNIFITPAGTLNNYASGVIDNSGSGIFTNEGLILNEGEINNFNCGIFVNNNRIINNQTINNEGIFFNNGTITNKPVMGGGVLTVSEGTSPLICRPFKQKLDPFGKTRVSATRLAAVRFDSCRALQYLINGEEFLDLTCADIGVLDVTLTLVDRRGNRVSCVTKLTITDENAPRIDSCPADILLANVAKAPAAASWTAPTFTDACDPNFTLTATHTPGDLFPEGATVVTYVAKDKFGNSFTCEFTVRVTVKKECPAKNATGLIAYYNLKPETSKYVFDRAAYGTPLHMEILNSSSIKYDSDCGLTNTGSSIVKSTAPANNVGNALMMSNAITVEAWVRADRNQDGPARVVTYSENTGARNFTLGQEGNRWVFRLKTTKTDVNGMPNREAASGSVKIGQLQHIVFTRAANGDERFYIDGQLSYSGNKGGNFSGWGAHCNLAFFNEMTLDRAFRGAIKKVAIYDRALAQSEVLASQAAGACCEGDDSPLGNICQGKRGEVSYERYENIDGWDLPWLFKSAKFPASPDVSAKLSKLEIPANVGDKYGSRTRGWIYPSTTGDYQFAIAADDQTNLLFSEAPDNAAYAYVIANVNSWTNQGELHKFSSQKSKVFRLQAGKGYYFELQHKEGNGGDHASIYWKTPGSNSFQVIGSANIGDVKSCNNGGGNNNCIAQRGGLLREVWNGINSNDVWALMADPRYPNNPDSRGLIDNFCGPNNIGDNYGTRVRGYLHPDVTGNYTFTVTGDNQTKLMLSTDETEANARLIADVNGWTGPTEFSKMPSQKSTSIQLEKGKRYFVELLHQEGTGGDFFNVFWQTPRNSTRHIVPGSNLSPYVDCSNGVQPQVCNRDVLLVVGNTRLNNGDAAVRARLVQLGYNVMVKDAKWATTALASDKGLVVISSTINSSDLGNRFQNLAVPVLTWESYLYDDLRMTKGGAESDYGSGRSKKLVVTGSTDQLAAGASGNQNVYTSNGDVRWGKVMNSGARIIANEPSDPWKVAVFAYDKDAQMAGGMRAPAIRIGFFLDDDGAACWTDYGRSLFDVAVRYATNCNGSEQLRISPDVLTLNAKRRQDEVELAWTNNTAYKNEYFLIERSSDNGLFAPLTTVEAYGMGDAMNSFNFVDAQPLEGQNFYRVTAMFNDGSQQESELRLVEFAQKGAVGIYPNPARENFTISLRPFEGKIVNMTMTDQLGRLVMSRVLDGNSGQTQIEVGDLPSGAYAVTLQSGGFLATELVVIGRD